MADGDELNRSDDDHEEEVLTEDDKKAAAMMDMDDSAFMNEPEPEPEPAAKSEEKPAEEESTETTEEEETTTEEESTEEETTEEETTEEETETEEETTTPEEEETTEEKPKEEESTGKEEEETKKTSDAEDADYKAIVAKLFAPFKANGVDMKVKNVDDAIRLMQMGANYQKKMTALRPSLATMKLLEKNGLLDQGKLNFLIDLHNHNPEAITKLIKESGTDPLNVKLDEESTYEPTNRTVSDTELLIDEVLGSIQDSPNFQNTLNVVSKEWDQSSRSEIAKNPNIIALLNQQMDSGVYAAIASEVQYQRSLGGLVGVSDFDAYKEIGQQLHDQGKLVSDTSEVPPKDTQKAAPVVKPEETSVDDERKKRKQAASNTRKKTTATTTVENLNPLEMSDEDFAKFDDSKAKELGLRD